MTVAAQRIAGSTPLAMRAESRSRVAVCALYAAVAVAAIYAPIDSAAIVHDRFIADAILRARDVPLIFGRETAASGAFWGGLGWLGALGVYALGEIRGGIVLGTVVIASATLGIVAARARAFSDSTFGIAATALAALCMGDAVHAGGPLTAPFLAAALIAVLDAKPLLRRTLAATGIALVWCNVSATGLLAGAFGVCAALGALLDRRRRECVMAWLTAAGTCAASLATPAGLAYPSLAFRALRIDGRPAFPSVAPHIVAPLGYWCGFTTVLVLALCFGMRARSWKHALPAMLALGLALANGNDLPLCGVVVAPLLAAAAERSDLPRRHRGAVRVAALALVAYAAFVVDAGARDGAARALANAQEAADALAVRAAGAPERRLYCGQPAWCSFAVAAGGRVFLDARFPVVPAHLRTAQLTLSRADPGWPRVAARYGVTALLIESDSPLAALVRLRSGWRADAVQGPLTLFVRARPHAACRDCERA